MTIPQPLLGTVSSLDELFKGFIFAPPHYSPLAFPLLGLPGTINPKTKEYLHAYPEKYVLDEAQAHCCNRHLGGFRSLHSDYWIQKELLPIYAYDFAKLSSTFIAVVPLSEMSRFTRMHQ